MIRSHSDFRVAFVYVLEYNEEKMIGKRKEICV